MLKGAVSAEVRAKGCESFVDKPWTINTSGGCCGVTGLPFADSEKLYDEMLASEKEAKDSVRNGRRSGSHKGAA